MPPRQPRPWLRIPEAEWEVGPPTAAEILRQQPKLKGSKAAGPCGVPNAVLRPPELAETLEKFAAQAFRGEPPEEWLRSFTCPIHKKGSLEDLNNYRAVTLMCAATKLYNRTLLERLRSVLDDRLRPNQNGFRQGRGTVGHIFALRRVIETSLERVSRNLVVLFVDFCAAFDSVYWQRLAEALRSLSVPEVLIDAVLAVYRGAVTAVRTGEGPTEWFRIWAGVLQGDTLAPYLFVLVVDVMLRRIMSEMRGFRFEVLGVEKSITDLDYADDLVLLASTLAEAQVMLMRLVRVAREHGLRVNFGPGKTEHLQTHATTVGLRTPEGAPVNVVAEYRYLGSWVTVTPDSSLGDWRRRKGLAWAALRKLTPVWRSRMRRV